MEWRVLAVSLGPGCVVALIIFGVFLAMFPGRNGGRGFFQVRRILRSGIPSLATIVAQRNVREVRGGSRPTTLTMYVTEFLLDVQRPEGAPLRVSVTLPLYWYEQDEIKNTHPLPVRVLDDVVAIDRKAVAAAVRAREAAKKAEADREFEAKRHS